MQWVMRVVCVGYFIFLTLLLLTTDPERLIGVQGRLPWILQAMLPLAHAISFLMLAVLALMTRWPVPRWSIVLALMIYGGMTEIIQSHVPHRTSEWADWFQDLAGIALGTACCWGAAVLVGKLTAARRSPEPQQSASSTEWTVTRRLLQRSIASGRSWWN
jgi:VanZ family protein